MLTKIFSVSCTGCSSSSQETAISTHLQKTIIFKHDPLGYFILPGPRSKVPCTCCNILSFTDARRTQPEWSSWSSWSSCSSTCGRDGTKFRHRFCRNDEKSGLKIICQVPSHQSRALAQFKRALVQFQLVPLFKPTSSYQVLTAISDIQVSLLWSWVPAKVR